MNMKQKYLCPEITIETPIIESLLETASPGVSDTPADPDQPVDSKKNTAADWNESSADYFGYKHYKKSSWD